MYSYFIVCTSCLKGLSDNISSYSEVYRHCAAMGVKIARPLESTLPQLNTHLRSQLCHTTQSLRLYTVCTRTSLLLYLYGRLHRTCANGRWATRVTDVRLRTCISAINWILVKYVRTFVRTSKFSFTFKAICLSLYRGGLGSKLCATLSAEQIAQVKS